MTNSLKITLALAYAVTLIAVSGCGACAHIFHMTAISYFPHKKSALCPPEPVPHFADPLYFGHYGTCWQEWPEGWTNCPCDVLYEQAIPDPPTPVDSGQEPIETIPNEGPLPESMDPEPAVPERSPEQLESLKTIPLESREIGSLPAVSQDEAERADPETSIPMGIEKSVRRIRPASLSFNEGEDPIGARTIAATGATESTTGAKIAQPDVRENRNPASPLTQTQRLNSSRDVKGGHRSTPIRVKVTPDVSFFITPASQNSRLDIFSSPREKGTAPPHLPVDPNEMQYERDEILPPDLSELGL